MRTIRQIFILSICMVFHASVMGQNSYYPSVVADQLIIRGDKYGWDANAVHTFSIVEANKDGYKYWGYYGLDHYQGDIYLRKAGLVRSNNLIDWEKYAGNPIVVANCRWPTVIISNDKFYMFYAEYKETNGDSRIVMVESDNGIDFENKRIVVPYNDGHQNQNPFIYFDKNDGNYYLFYYNGTERTRINPRWNVLVRKCKNLSDMPLQKSYEVLSSDKTLAAPSVAYYNNMYYLLVEEFADDSQRSWVTNAFSSKNIDKGYERVANNPILYKNDACAFQYVLGGNLYVTYSHCLNIQKGNWVLRMMKVE